MPFSFDCEYKKYQSCNEKADSCYKSYDVSGFLCHVALPLIIMPQVLACGMKVRFYLISTGSSVEVGSISQMELFHVATMNFPVVVEGTMLDTDAVLSFVA